MAIVTPRGVQVHPPSSRINYKRRPAPSHSNTTLSSSQILLLWRPLLSPFVAFCIPIASTARTVLARADLRNLCNAEILLGIAGQSGFWGVSWCDCSHPERLRPLLPGGRQMSTSSTSRWPYLCSQVNIKIVSTTSWRPSALQRLSLATSNSPDWHNIQSWERRTRCLQHWSCLGVHSKPILVYYLFMFISENNMNMSTYFVSTISLIYAIKLIMSFRIKIYQKLPSYLTTSSILRICHLNLWGCS
jgi:hypothetical protein